MAPKKPTVYELISKLGNSATTCCSATSGSILT